MNKPSPLPPPPPLFVLNDIRNLETNLCNRVEAINQHTHTHTQMPNRPKGNNILVSKTILFSLPPYNSLSNLILLEESHSLTLSSIFLQKLVLHLNL